MIVVRFNVQCQPEKTEQVLAAFEECIAPSRAVDGVVSFDIARDLADPDSFIAVEVFEDRAALERQESQPVIQKTLGVLGESLIAELRQPSSTSPPPSRTVPEERSHDRERLGSEAHVVCALPSSAHCP